jgi:hypothetical protein
MVAPRTSSLHQDLQRLVPLLCPVDDELVVPAQATNREQDLFHGARKQVDPADDEHVVRAAAKLRDSRVRAPAPAGLVDQDGAIAGPVTDNR